jgi:hypothetical protein
MMLLMLLLIRGKSNMNGPMYVMMLLILFLIQGKVNMKGLVFVMMHLENPIGFYKDPSETKHRNLCWFRESDIIGYASRSARWIRQRFLNRESYRMLSDNWFLSNPIRSYKIRSGPISDSSTWVAVH